MGLSVRIQNMESPSMFSFAIIIVVTLISYVSAQEDGGAPDFSIITNVKRIPSQHHADSISSTAQTFRDFILSTDLWVDKSLLMKAIFEIDEKVIVITCPRRWGKTLNLNMMRMFFMNKESGSAIENAFSRDFFEKGQIVHEDAIKKMAELPKISSQSSFMNKHFQNYPTICVSFKDLNDVDNYISQFRQIVSKVYMRHIYLVDHLKEKSLNETLNSSVRLKASIVARNYERICARDQNDEAVLVDAIHDLCELLFEHHGKPVVVLIDEYDSLISESTLHYRGDSIAQEKALKFCQNFMSVTFKNSASPCIRKAVLTGIVRIAKTTMLSHLNTLIPDITDLNIVNMGTLTPFYGFYHHEVVQLLQHVQRSDQIQDVTEWYDGYSSMYKDKPNVRSYSPWSIICFIVTGNVGSHWDFSGSQSVLRNLLRYEFFYNIIYGIRFQNLTYKIEIKHLQKINSEGLKNIQDLLNNNEPFRYEYHERRSDVANCQMVLVAFLCQTGYLTVSGQVPQRDFKNMKQNVVDVKIPNHEIREAFADLLVEKIRTYFVKQSSNTLNDLLDKASEMFTEWFLKDDMAAFGELQKLTEQLYEASGPYVENPHSLSADEWKNVVPGSRSLNEMAVRSVFVLLLDKFYRKNRANLYEGEGGEIMLNEEGKNLRLHYDAVVTLGNRILIIEYKNNRLIAIENVLQQAKNYSLLLMSKPTEYSVIKFLAINFYKDISNSEESYSLKMKDETISWSKAEEDM